MSGPDGTTDQNGAGRGDTVGPGAPFGANRFARAGAQAQEEPPVVIRDKRRIDQTVGESTEPVEEPAVDADASAVDAALAESALALAERTADLQRLQAEYANYRKRADRERQAAGEIAVGAAVANLLPVLDDVARARQHGDLTGAFKSVADGLDTVLAKLGLVPFGEAGDPFDPSIHEAVLHDESDTVTVSTASTVMRPGYRFGDRLLRPAMVGVTDPAGPAAAPEPAPDALHDDAEEIGI